MATSEPTRHSCCVCIQVFLKQLLSVFCVQCPEARVEEVGSEEKGEGALSVMLGAPPWSLPTSSLLSPGCLLHRTNENPRRGALVVVVSEDQPVSCTEWAPASLRPRPHLQHACSVPSKETAVRRCTPLCVPRGSCGQGGAQGLKCHPSRAIPPMQWRVPQRRLQAGNPGCAGPL